MAYFRSLLVAQMGLWRLYGYHVMLTSPWFSSGFESDAALAATPWTCLTASRRVRGW